uniref:Peptidase_M1 domain-containing protein n=1 Tax=Angiostrongylus cantonensis TaxID=6313 RepID=A0A0K0CWZ3_ANGCA
LGDRSVSGEGILIFREDSLLFDPSTDSVEEKVKIVTALCYEITHQWFGSLVSVVDWPDLWLVGAFSRYMEYLLTEKIFVGAIDTMSYQLVESVETALLDDDGSLSHPLTFKTEFPTDVYEFNEQTTHDKVGSLKMHWKTLATIQYFSLYIRIRNHLQMGYPVVDVYRLNSHTIELTQRRFKLQLNNVIPEKEKFRNAVYWYKWEVPIFYEINGTKQEMICFSDSILINSESFGFYRVNYDQQEWIAIADQLTNNHTVVSLVNKRASLISRYGRLAFNDTILIFSRTKKEIVKTYCQLSPQSCTKTLVTQFKTNLMASCERSEIASECSKVPLSIRSLVYCTGVAEIEPEGLEQIREFYVREVNEAERRRLVAALSCSKDPGQLRKYVYLNDLAHIPKLSYFLMTMEGIRRVEKSKFSGDFVTFSNMLKNAIHLGNEREIKQVNQDQFS